MARRFSWEDRDYADPSEGEDAAEEVDSEDPDSLGESDSALAFESMLVDLVLRGTLSAKGACCLAFWAGKGGLRREGASLGRKPGQTGGVYARHFDKITGLREGMKGDFYTLPVPSYERWSLGRSVQDVACALPHHVLAEEIFASPGFFEVARRTVATAPWAEVYAENTIVQARAEDFVVPLGLFMDGVQYLQRGSMVGVWVINLINERRHLICCLKKNTLCKCGCKGWCSLSPMFTMLAWSFKAMVDGLYPEQRSDGAPWGADEPTASLAGQPLGFHAALILIKGDWAEVVSTWGFPSWQSHKDPCFVCKATGHPDGGTVFGHEGLTHDNMPFELKDQPDYELQCGLAEVRYVIPDVETLDMIVSRLFYDRRDSGSQGRALKEDVPGTPLVKGLRLEPSPCLPDVAGLDNVCVFPFEAVFWNPTARAGTKHRNPMFDPAIGVTPRTLCVDELHTMHLGVFQDFVSRALWALLDKDVWNSSPGATEEVKRKAGAIHLRHDLFAYYGEEKRTRPDRPCYELQDFSLRSLGTRTKPMLRAKGAESGTLVRFAYKQLLKHWRALDRGAALKTCGKALVAYLNITRLPGNLGEERLRHLKTAVLLYLNNREAAGIPWKPKAHLMVHLVWQCARFGNPRLVGTWHDESLNRELAQVARSAHSRVWHTRVLAVFSDTRGPTNKAAAKRQTRQRRE